MITIIHDSLASVGAKTGGHEDGVELFFFLADFVQETMRKITVLLALFSGSYGCFCFLQQFSRPF